MPFWIPSTLELQSKYKGDVNSEIVVYFFDQQDSEEYVITEKTTVSSLIEEIRGSTNFAKQVGKDFFPQIYWLYIMNEDESQFD